MRGPLGTGRASLSERLRRAVDLEHWAAFNRSFEQLCDWLRRIARGAEETQPPATILLLGGDVHCSSMSEVDLGSGSCTRVTSSSARRSAIRSSPTERRILQATGSRFAAKTFALLAKLARVEPPSTRWAPIRKPTFENALGELVLEGRAACATIRRSPREGEDPELLVADQPLTLTDAGRPERAVRGDRPQHPPRGVRARARP